MTQRSKKPRKSGPPKQILPKWKRDYLEACLDPEIKPTITARCESIGIDRTTYYRWIERPAFVAWFKEQMEAVSADIAPEHALVRRALLRKCLSGDMEAIKHWNEFYGAFIPSHRVVVESEQVGSLSDEQLDQLAAILTSNGSPGKTPTVH